MRTETVLDGGLSIHLNLDQSPIANSRFGDDMRNRAHLASQLLLYERILIPTHDMGIVPILISWLGPKIFDAAIESRTLSFIKKRSTIGYAGNGNGLSGFRIDAKPGQNLPWWVEAKYAGVHDALDLQLKNECAVLSGRERTKLCERVIKNATVHECPNEIFIRDIAHETYRDVKGSEQLISILMKLERFGSEGINLERMPSVRPDALRVLNLDETKDGVDLLLRIAEVNLELVMASANGGSDLCASTGTEAILRNKLGRAGLLPTASENLVRVMELSGVPDVTEAVTSSAVSLNEVWKVRQEKEAIEFRNWFRSIDDPNPRTIEKAYVESLSRSSFYNRLPTKIVRFAVTTAADVLFKGAGTLIGVADNFFIEKWLTGFSPKLFLDKWRELAIEETSR
jgi:hypothetical protein